MVVTHLFQVLAFTAMEPPTALEPFAISEEKNKVFRSMAPIDPSNVVRGQYAGYRDEPGVAPESETETFIALKCEIDNWRWAGVPFYLRTGKHLAEGARIISIAFKEPPRSMFPAGSGVGQQGPDHLTFDLADKSRMSLSFYGKRPGPGMKLDKLSMQFAMQETNWAGAALEAYERLIYDAMRGDHTLFNTADGIERLWEVSVPLLENPPPVRPYAPRLVGPEPDPPARGAHRVAAAVRAHLARPERGRRLSRSVDGSPTAQRLHLAQVNVSRLVAPLSSEQLAGFVAASGPIEVAGAVARGFVWRTHVEVPPGARNRPFDWDVGDSAGLVVNLSVWESLEALEAFVHSSPHREALRQSALLVRPAPGGEQRRCGGCRRASPSAWSRPSSGCATCGCSGRRRTPSRPRTPTRPARRRSERRPQPSASRAGNPPVATGPHRVGVIRSSDLPCAVMACRYSSQSGCSPEIARK